MIRPLTPALVALALALPVAAQEATRIPSHCTAIAGGPGMGPERVIPARFGTPLEEGRVRIRYVNHATFTLETPGGLVAATDFTGFLGPRDVVPDVVTMNNSHSTHWTASPDPRIPHVLEGWLGSDHGRLHELDLGEMLVRNVPTDTRSSYGDGVRREGNSIFVFEVAGLCIGHLGHLHQIPDDAQYASIGRLDVVMVPVDGGYTMSTAAMAEVAGRLRSSVILPMHWFSGASLERFLTEVEGEFDVVRLDQPDIELSLGDLPGRPTVMVLMPEMIR